MKTDPKKKNGESAGQSQGKELDNDHLDVQHKKEAPRMGNNGKKCVSGTNVGWKNG